MDKDSAQTLAAAKLSELERQGSPLDQEERLHWIITSSEDCPDGWIFYWADERTLTGRKEDILNFTPEGGGYLLYVSKLGIIFVIIYSFHHMDEIEFTIAELKEGRTDRLNHYHKF